jgi:hypothetical protein
LRSDADCGIYELDTCTHDGDAGGRKPDTLRGDFRQKTEVAGDGARATQTWDWTTSTFSSSRCIWQE